jgi:C4-dicarboxylate transporter DctQ subunit
LRFLEAYRKVNDALEALIVGFTGVVVLLIVALPFVAAVVRFGTGEGYTWLAESPPQLVPWVVFPLLGVLLRHDHHIAVDVLPHSLSGSRLAALRLIVLSICLVSALAFAAFGTRTVLFFQKLGQMSTTEIEFPLWVLYMSYPIGFLLAANFCLEVLLREARGQRTAAGAPGTTGM